MREDGRSLEEAYQRTAYQIAGHGFRTVGVLKEALAGVGDDTPSDHYGTGAVLEAFQEKMADYLGKPAAVFFPSGTMAQQIALRIWCDRVGIPRVAYHPLCHLEIHEQDGLKRLHRIEPILLGEPTRLITADDVKGLEEEVACLLLELPQREIGGQLPSWEELGTTVDAARGRGLRLHLDGARLYETLPYYQKSAQEVATLFDSVYISFYKGVGGVAGAVLAGPTDFIQEAVIWKRRHGGDLISLYPYVLAADHYFDRRLPKMSRYWEDAQELAALFNGVGGVQTVPRTPMTNMFHVHVKLPPDEVRSALIAVGEATGVGFASFVRDLADGASFEISVGDRYGEIPKPVLHRAFAALQDILSCPASPKGT